MKLKIKSLFNNASSYLCQFAVFFKLKCKALLVKVFSFLEAKFKRWKQKMQPKSRYLKVNTKLLRRYGSKKLDKIIHKNSFEELRIAEIREAHDYLFKQASFSVNVVYRYAIWFFALFFLWSIFAKLDSSVYANGMFAPSTRKKIIQHFEGGIVDKILVNEGDLVKQGQVLVILNDISAKASLATNKNDLMQMLVREKRLNTELEFEKDLTFDYNNEDGVDEKILQRVVNYEKGILLNNIKIYNDKLSGLLSKDASNISEIGKNKTKLFLYNNQLEIVKKDIRVESILIKKKIGDYEKLRKLQTEMMNLENEIQAAEKTLEQLDSTKDSIESEIDLLKSEYKQKVNEELSATEQKINELKENINVSSDIKKRTEITSPVDGVITTIKVTGAGQVVNSSTEIMEIVPVDDEVIIEAKVSPRDISLLHSGLEAKIIPNLAENKLKRHFMGTVFYVSNDAQYEQNGNIYFLAKIRTKVKRFDNIEFTPGMSVSVLINLGSRRPIVFLLEPFLNSVVFSFNEY